MLCVLAAFAGVVRPTLRWPCAGARTKKETSVHPAIESHDLVRLFTTMKALRKAESAEHDKSEAGGYGGTAHAPPVLTNRNDSRNPWSMAYNARRGACGAKRSRHDVKKVDSLF